MTTILDTLAAKAFPHVNRPDAVFAVRQLLEALREHAGDPGIVEAMARIIDPSAYAHICGQRDAAKDLRAGKYEGTAEEIEKMAADCDRKGNKIADALFDIARRALTAALSHVLAEGEG